MFLVSSVIPMDVAKSETLNTIDSLLPPKKRMRLTEPPTDNAPVSAAIKKVSFPNNTKYKGVVQHQNGHWGAQIYVDHKRIWLGTFRSAAEAAMGYDSASIKLRSFDANSHRNFPWSDLTVHEPVFQKRYTTEAVLNMIKDGSYQREFKEFLKNRSQKELTASDVGKLNRLVIPKKYAVKYLPFLSDDQTEREEGEIVEDVEVVFYDREMKQWKFRWSEQELLMVDVHRFSDNDSAVTDEEVNKTVHNSCDDVMKPAENFNSKLGEEENRGGFMLFGVRIQ
ncbi:hypothetical protein Bca52824_080718 [Brassica carinata]|uniref:AP2/ERF domain-containing protein n=1 Tax=Brassica carinata TaxID=52824 RepID=A0A8X7PGL8_BRACI|nr:hypothetical protein Bca52824_080718 [Brassica carinata]